MSTDLEAWFCQEILPYEAALIRYLRRRHIGPADLDDIRHEVYVRIIETAERALPESPKSFMFAIAHNILVDRIRRERIVSVNLTEDIEELNVLVDEISPERGLNGSQLLNRLVSVFDAMPSRCREVVWMKRIESLPQREIAHRLGIAESTVEKHLIRGIGLLAGALHDTDTVQARAADTAKNRIELEADERANRSRAHGRRLDSKARQWKLDESGC